MAREYTSHPGEDRPPPTWPFSLDLERFTCTLRQDADAVMEWSEIATTALSAEGDERLESAAGLAFTSRFFKLMMEPAEYQRFRAHLRDHKTDPGVLSEIMQDVNAEMERLVEQTAARPTRPSGSSSAGRGARAGRTSKIISLPDADIEWADAPSGSRQQRRAQARRGGRRRAG